jgi:hypothetical protein
MSSGCGRIGLHESEELAGGVALEAAQDLFRGETPVLPVAGVVDGDHDTLVRMPDRSGGQGL